MKTAHQYAISVKMKIVCMGFSYSARFYVNRKASQKNPPISEALGDFFLWRLSLIARKRLADVNDEREQESDGSETNDDLTGRAGEESGDTGHHVSENRVDKLDEDVSCKHTTKCSDE